MSEDTGKDQDPFETMPDLPEAEKEAKKEEAPPEPKKPSDEDDWKTAEFKGAEVKDVKAAAAQKPAKAPAKAPAAKPAAKPAAAGSMAASAPAAAASEGGSKPWNFLSRVGIENENTQKYVLFGGGGLILLCCLCSCVGVILTYATNSGGF